jgi:guanylate kinase
MHRPCMHQALPARRFGHRRVWYAASVPYLTTGPQVHGNLYGTSIAAVKKVLESGRVCVLDIDVQVGPGAALQPHTTHPEAMCLPCPNPLGERYSRACRLALRAMTPAVRVHVLAQGARSVRKAGLRAIFVFIAPPSLEDLANRLAGRGTETVEQITRRLNNAKAEIERCRGWPHSAQQRRLQPAAAPFARTHTRRPSTPAHARRSF